MREVHAGDVVDGPAWTVTVGHAQHVQPHLECLAFRIDSDEGSLCYTGDSGDCDEIIELARGCDVLIHMNHHLSGSEASAAYRAACGDHEDNARTAQRAGVKTLVLTHLLEQIDAPVPRERILHEIQQVFDGRVIWGEDLCGSRCAGKHRRRPARTDPADAVPAAGERPIIFGAVCLLLLVVVAAAIGPARRAGQADPDTALRST